MQKWVKIMAEREIFLVQNFLDQPILVYDNFQSMEIATKELYGLKKKKKKKKKNPFWTFTSGFEKKS